MSRKISNDIYIPIILEAVREKGSAPLLVSGNSMRPFLKAGRDTVILDKPEGLKTGDIVLFKRHTGQYVLHRIVEITEGGIYIKGDNQNRVDGPIGYDEILAMVICVKRRRINIRRDGYIWRIYRRKAVK